MKNLFLAILFVLMSVGPAHADKTVTLTWEAPIGMPASDIAGYELLYGNASGVYGVTVPTGNVLTYNLTLKSGHWYFVVRTVDIEGFKSGFSNECDKLIRALPISPGGLKCDFKE